MATTPQGTPYFASGDAPDLPLVTQGLAQRIDRNNTSRQGYNAAASYSVATSTVFGVPGYGDPAYSYDGSDGSITYASGVFTVVNAGVYQWNGTVTWAAPSGTPAAHQRHIGVMVNGNGSAYIVTPGRDINHVPSGITVGFNHSSTGCLNLNAGDTVQLFVYHNAGSNQTLTEIVFGLSRFH